jgi:predicted site-specific integrase-resolvase
MKQDTQAAVLPMPLLLDASAAAAFVGVQVGVLRRWVRDGLPFVRAGAGGRKMYVRRDLERFIERLKETTNG